MRARRDDTGAAVAEFAMISVLLVLLLFGVLQVGVYFYARNIVSASAADAARFAAAYGVPADEGGARAEQLIASGLGATTARGVRCVGSTGADRDSGLAVAIVHCTGRIHAFLAPFDLPLRVDFTASALKETHPGSGTTTAVRPSSSSSSSP